MSLGGSDAGRALDHVGRDLPRPHEGKKNAALHTIALVEAIKGVLALAMAIALELLGPAPLQRWAQELVHRFRMDESQGTLAWLSRQINPESLHLVVVAVLAYGSLRGLEAWGLRRGRTWASWLGCVSAALFLPVDLIAIHRHPGWASVTALLINLIIVWILARDLRERRR